MLTLKNQNFDKKLIFLTSKKYALIITYVNLHYVNLYYL